jgi:HEAT repeats
MQPMSVYTRMMVAVICVTMCVGGALAQGKGNTPTVADVEKLQAEITRLRADLDAALREISTLKAVVNGGKPAADEGPLYRGRSAKSWLEQLKDAEPKTRIDALEAIGVLAQKDKKLVPVLAETAKNGAGKFVANAAVKALGAAGPEALPALIELVKDKKERYQAVTEIGAMGPKAKSAVPALAKALEEESTANALRKIVSALREIGPDAKEAIPALVKTLGKTLEDIGMPETTKSTANRFGVSPNSVNVVIVKTLSDLDPALAKDVPLPIIPDVTKGAGGRRASTLEEQEEWRRLHAALVNRYAKPK